MDRILKGEPNELLLAVTQDLGVLGRRLGSHWLTAFDRRDVGPSHFQPLGHLGERPPLALANRGDQRAER